MSDRQLIVSADDMGLTEGHNRAVVQAHNEGILTSASLLACGAAFDDAVARAGDLPSLGVGVHLTLLEGTPVRPAAAVPNLVRAGQGGAFGTGYGKLLWGVTLGRVALAQVRAEWRGQIERVLDSGLRVTHIDSHKHLHMHPQLLGIALALASEAGIPRMRLSRPPRLVVGKSGLLGLLAAWAGRRMARQGVRFPTVLLGLEASGQMTVERMVEAIRTPWHGVCELMTHPAHPGPELARLAARGCRWIEGYRFRDELDALCAPQVRATLREGAVELVSYERL